MKRLSPKTGKPFKWGEQREDGFRFSCYLYKRIKLNGFYYEIWSSPSVFKKNIQKSKNKHYHIKNHSTGKYKINPSTKKIWKRGDVHPVTGSIFDYYIKTSVYKNGYYPLSFISRAALHKKSILSAIRRRKKDGNKNINLDANYLFKIFPKDSICPALGIKMKWGGNIQSSPALDKIIPEAFYTMNNVCWISFRANSIKSDASYEEIIKVGKWMKKKGL